MAKLTDASAFTLSDYPLNSDVGGSSSSPSFGASDDDLDDACSICLEPFTLQDPATVTSCKHEYHLQCILEWSQRSKECPICWQMFALKDPASQQLLSAVDKERSLRSKNISSASPLSSAHRSPNANEEALEFNDEQFMRRLSEAAHRRGLVRRRESQRSTQIGSSNNPTTISRNDIVDPDQSRDGLHISDLFLSNNFMTPSATASPRDNSSVSSDGNNILRFFPSLSPSPSPQSADSAEASSLPETIKSKLAAASVRCKESISKSKQDLKEKLLIHNNSVKELSKGVHREMNAGIAGVARMMERLDLAAIRLGGSGTASNSTSGSRFDFSFKGKRAEETTTTSETLNRSSGDP